VGPVKKQLLAVALGLVAVLIAAGQLAHALAGPSPNDIQDSQPWWDADGVHLAFSRTAPGLRHVVTSTSAGKDLYVAWQSGTSRGYAGRYFLVESNDETIVTTGGRFSGPNAILHGTDASASRDGTQVAYLRSGTLYVASTAGIPPSGAYPIYSPPKRAVATGIDPTATDIVGPAWSPDGTRIAVSTGDSLLLVKADGSGSRVLAQGANPSWSPDGRTIAFDRAGRVRTIGADGSGERDVDPGKLAQYAPFGNKLAFISDQQHLKGGATPFQFALYVDDGNKTYKLVDDVHPFSPPRWSPTGALIAVSAGQECFRWGIYVGRPDIGSRFTRHSNICRFTGTPGNDTIRGSYYFDRINGLGGNDLIKAFDGNDAIYGENGNDTILAGNGNDFVLAGPGDDRIYGGAGNDTIIPGNGHDVVDCGPGIDTVEGSGPLDRISKNCEHVRH
jgi:Tol biopolymer transport system component